MDGLRAAMGCDRVRRNGDVHAVLDRLRESVNEISNRSLHAIIDFNIVGAFHAEASHEGIVMGKRLHYDLSSSEQRDSCVKRYTRIVNALMKQRTNTVAISMESGLRRGSTMAV